MLSKLENKSAPLASRRVFLGRLGKCFLITTAIVGWSLLGGTLGYHYLADKEWLDALLNASMILSGMGPVGDIGPPEGKLFACAYALYSGLALVSMSALLMAPLYHRLMHRLHLEDLKAAGEDD